ncbi:unnamed protein product [Parnassius apollo]|uniref:unspecific monooxygenase n=1 Tax=Parnassius apollo TaxID=110799 RepID=A0A8S3Y7S8_PARAO|nr:unnamed protein product [Parnassius apollo]
MTIYNNFWRKRNVAQGHEVIWKFMTENKSLPEIYKDIYDAYPKEDNVGIFLGSKPAIILRNLENLQAVLQGDFQSFYSRGFVINSNDLLADNVLFMDDYNRWRIVRQKISPVFTSKKLKNMFYILERCAQDFVKLIENSQQAKDKPFNALYTYTTASIAAAIFGIDTYTKNTMDSPFLEMAWKALEPTFLTNLKFTISNMFPKLYNLLKLKLFGEHEDFFINVVKSVLKARRSELEKRHDFIDTCIELQKEGLMKDSSTGFTLNPSDELMAAQAFFFFIAGADTSAHTMLFVLLEISGNPGVLQKLHEEIDNVFDQCKENITFDNIESMKYLNMVMNEAMRKYPTIGAVQRRCTRQTTLPVGQVKMEKDEIAVIPIYALHRDERYFPNPDLFDPERFSPENSSKILKYSYLPFGEGNRVCLGERFARLQVKVGLAWLLRRYTLKEQVYKPKHFEPSSFGIQDPNARFDLIAREKFKII